MSLYSQPLDLFDVLSLMLDESTYLGLLLSPKFYIKKRTLAKEKKRDAIAVALG
ncbi:uncharacterized protein PHALS_12069 [Plasmopara halstedii]|uniref:Uncharacterized protein n=1 Tax=Plasmopara halstedii TaxID=4781 RepID=A0A0P1AKF6_PLAHL|nr:uncharacterized protein PHALS_12069 [Plasmopara halstedii]CEG41740.1 hypothetical protein PHALS_12069 [Plasmopara halstedii]|eukprot:XP_024578109.1 hypothetical protein PHALS_12069 [Plasmopara halstedii]